jgi:hypothetical protein
MELKIMVLAMPCSDKRGNLDELLNKLSKDHARQRVEMKGMIKAVTAEAGCRPSCCWRCLCDLVCFVFVEPGLCSSYSIIRFYHRDSQPHGVHAV